MMVWQLLIFVLLIFVVFAATTYPANLSTAGSPTVLTKSVSSLTNKTVSKYLEPSDSIELIWLNESAGMLLVKLNGAETFIINDSRGEIVTDANVTVKSLADYIRSTGNYSRKLAASIRQLEEFNASKASGEAVCKRMTGLDHLPCVDRVSCLVCCLAVPNCQMIAYGEGVVQAVMEYRQALNRYEQSYPALRRSLEITVANSSHIVNATKELYEYKSAVMGINNAKLLGKCGSCFNYCKPYNWSLAKLAASEDSLIYLQYLESLSENLGPHAKLILNETARTKAYRYNRAENKSRLISRLDRMDAAVVSGMLALQAGGYGADIREDYRSYLNYSNLTRGLIGRGDVRLALASEPELDRVGGIITFGLSKRLDCLANIALLKADIEYKLAFINSGAVRVDQSQAVQLQKRYAEAKAKMAVSYVSLLYLKSDLEDIYNSLDWLMASGAPSQAICLVPPAILFTLMGGIAFTRRGI